MKIDVLIFAAHPDDAELGMGGTIAKMTKDKLKVGIIDLSKGEMGTRGTVEDRKLEAENAGEALGINLRVNLGMPDGDLKPIKENINKIVSVIRHYKPKLIFAPYINDRHPDHVGTSTMVKEAMFFCGAGKYESEWNGKTQELYRPKKLYYFMQTYETAPSFIVDISDTFETKMKGVRAFTSQFHNPDSNEPETFISNPKFISYLESRAQYYGFKINKNYGEAFYSEEQIELNIKNHLKVI